MSTNFEDLILRDETGNRPAAGVPGRLFYDTTLEKWQRDTGADWEDCEPDTGGDMDNPMTTAGDIIYGGVDGDPTRLGIGDDDDVLTLASGVPTWAAPAGGGGFSTGDIQQVELYRSVLAEAGRFDTTGVDLSGYDHLIIRSLTRSSVAATYDTNYMLFNNDSTAGNYKAQYRSTYNATTGANITDTPRAGDTVGANGRANCASYTEIFIPLYAGTTFEKIAQVRSSLRIGDAAGDEQIIEYTYHWESTSAITRVQYQPDGYDTDKFAAGSFCQVIGVKTVA